MPRKFPAAGWTTIPAGFGVKIPLEDLLPDFLPKEDRRYKVWAEKKAAADLQQWIKEITGATLDISSGDARGSAITVRTDPSLGDEGYAHHLAESP